MAKTIFSDEHKANLSKGHLGIKLSEETKRKISESQKKRLAARKKTTGVDTQ